MRRKETGNEGRVYVKRLVLLLGGIALVWWAGWRSPWSRASESVRIEAPGAPVAAATAPAAQPVDAPSSAQAAPQETRPADTARAEEPAAPRRRHRRRRHTARPMTDIQRPTTPDMGAEE